MFWFGFEGQQQEFMGHVANSFEASSYHHYHQRCSHQKHVTGNHKGLRGQKVLKEKVTLPTPLPKKETSHFILECIA